MIDKYITGRKAIRLFCLWCMSNQTHEVKLCPREVCPLWIHRESRGPGGKMRPIRLKCMECSGSNDAEVRRCKHKDCSLFGFRMGKRGKADKIQG